MSIGLMILLSLKLLWRNDFANASIDVYFVYVFHLYLGEIGIKSSLSHKHFSSLFLDDIENVHVVYTPST
jgi:hypothetical protein